MCDSFGYSNELIICVVLGFRVVLEEFQNLAEQKSTEGYSKLLSGVHIV
jgi:hypothetical protein